MATRDGGLRERLRALFADAGLPGRAPLPRWLAPVPRPVENLGLRLAPLVAVVNLVGTAFGFWYYGLRPFSSPAVQGQFAGEPLAAWPVVPDSPVATLFVALAFLLWWRGRPSEYLNALAFFGCLKLGAWTPYVLVLFATEPGPGFLGVNPLPMYLFLVGSHLAMVLEGFVLHRIADFPVRAVAVALAWYGLNDVVDYFLPVVGTPHHTLIVGQRPGPGGFTHLSAFGGAAPPVHELAAVGAVVLTLLATFLALATRVRKLEAGALGG